VRQAGVVKITSSEGDEEANSSLRNYPKTPGNKAVEAPGILVSKDFCGSHLWICI
jgi:hypothetical protein